MKTNIIGIVGEPPMQTLTTARQATRWLAALALLASAIAPLPIQADMLVSSWGQGSVLRFDENTGAPLSPFVSPNSGGLQAPTAVAFGRDGNLYVCDGLGNQILRYNGQTGAFLDVFAKTNLNTPYGIAFGSDGKVYVSNMTGKNIVVFHEQTGALLGLFGEGVLQRPRDLKFGRDGALYVADGLAGVMRFDVLTGTATNFVPPTNFSLLDGSFGLVFGADGNLYVSDIGNNRVLRFNETDGSAVQPIPFASGCGLDNVAGVAFGPDGDLWAVSNEGIRGIIKYSVVNGACVTNIVIGVGGLQFVLFTPPLRVNIRVSEVEIAWNSVSNATYSVEYKSSLTTNQWSPLVGCVQATGTTTRAYDKINIGDAQRFYRVVATNCVP